MPLFDKNYDMLYNDYNKLRNAVPTQPIAYRTVFNDIADEWANCTEEERRFIDGDPEYINANLTYQQQFNAFLLDMVGLQFINSQYGKSAESVLITLKNAKAKLFLKHGIFSLNGRDTFRRFLFILGFCIFKGYQYAFGAFAILRINKL